MSTVENQSLQKRNFSLNWWLCNFELSWMLFKTMDKAARLSITEKKDPQLVIVSSPLRYLPLLSTPFRNRKHNPSVSLFCFSPSGGVVVGQLLFHLFSPSPSIFLFFLLWKTQLSACLSGATPQMKWHTVEKTERHSVAWPETEFPWRLLLSATQAIVAQRCNAGDRLHFYTVTSLSSGNQMKSLFRYIARLIHVRDTKDYDYL